MEIIVDDAGRVFVLRNGRGTYQVLNPDGSATEEFIARGATVILADDARPERDRGAEYEEGFADGWREAIEEAQWALDGVSPPPRRKRPQPTATTTNTLGGAA